MQIRALISIFMLIAVSNIFSVPIGKYPFGIVKTLSVTEVAGLSSEFIKSNDEELSRILLDFFYNRIHDGKRNYVNVYLNLEKVVPIFYEYLEMGRNTGTPAEHEYKKVFLVLFAPTSAWSIPDGTKTGHGMIVDPNESGIFKNREPRGWMLMIEQDTRSNKWKILAKGAAG